MGYPSEGSWPSGFGTHKDGWNGDIVSAVIDPKVEVKTWERMREDTVVVWT